MIGSPAVSARPAAGVDARSRPPAAWISRALIYVSVAVAVGAQSSGYPAFVRLLANGRAILDGAGPAGRFDALSSTLYAVVERAFGFGGVAAFSAFCAVALLALVEAQAQARGASELRALVAGAGAALLSIGTFRADVDSFSWMLAAAFGLALVWEDARRPAVAILLAWAWASSSWIGAAAPALALAAAFGRRGDRALLAVAAGSALAVFATAAGLDLPREALAQLSFADPLSKVIAWEPNAIAPEAYRFGLVPLVVALACLRLPRLADWPVVVVALFCAFASGAALPLAGIAILPCLVPAAANGSQPAPATSRSALSALGIALVCTLIAPATADLRAKAGVPAAAPAPLLDALAALPAETSGRTVLCQPVNWCALVEALGRSDVRAFASDRIGGLDARRLADQVMVAHVRPAWRSVLERNGIDTIVVGNRQGLAALLAMQPDWRAAFRTERVTLFVRAARSAR